MEEVAESVEEEAWENKEEELRETTVMEAKKVNMKGEVENKTGEELENDLPRGELKEDITDRMEEEIPGDIQTGKEAMVKGYLLLEKGSQVCLPQLLMDDILPYDNFTVCLLLRPQGGHGRFFHYNDNNTQLTAGKQLEVAVDGRSFIFNTSLPPDLWTPLCLGYSSNTQQPWVMVHGKVLAMLSNSSSSTPLVSGVCLGGPQQDHQLGGWVAGVSMRADQDILHHPASATCLSMISTALQSSFTWHGQPTFAITYFHKEELCSQHEHHNFWLHIPLDYSQAELLCEVMGGNLPVPHTNLMTTLTINTHKKLQGYMSWSSDAQIKDLHSQGQPPLRCPILFFNGTMASHPCGAKLPYSACVAPTWLRYTLYGTIPYHDRYYFIKTSEDASAYFQGLHRLSTISKMGNTWALHSHLDLPQWHLDPSFQWPVGRQLWFSDNTSTSTTLTLTICSPLQFSIHNGFCIPRHHRCDGKVHSPDESDEVNCRKREVKNVILTLPYLSHNNDFFEKVKKYEIRYRAAVQNIDIVDTRLKTVKVLMLLQFKWTDPSLQFRDFRNFSDTSCDEFWNPKLDVNIRTGKVDPNVDYKFCYVRYNNSEYLDINDHLMGRIVEGKDVELTTEITTDMIIDCRTHLHRYPFGTHQCSFNLFIRDTYPLKFFSTHDLVYLGTWNLKDYDLLNITSQRTTVYNHVFKLSFYLRSQYGYYLLTSFVPSGLMFIISYITFLFPLTAFSERVMASLTALLVLAALFTQASSNYVKTTYFKLIDLWYCTFILLCFSTVACNVIINSLLTVSKCNSVKPSDIPTIHSTTTQGYRRARACNLASLVVFFLVFVGLVVGFILYATEVI
ncbi:hypothetical protein Pmani_023021 [Petrolisthes manimaculis]|uniref:Uncharacterized protein n=1 Tax=Petrolisthes manimaculis TaxID=1843537 RepID=A0AAE1PDB5_9EUCA|nr:hypothetical protein Pmani_023021 [Petrolisthes manimaculis]